MYSGTVSWEEYREFYQDQAGVGYIVARWKDRAHWEADVRVGEIYQCCNSSPIFEPILRNYQFFGRRHCEVPGKQKKIS
jgi:hypothetical protein